LIACYIFLSTSDGYVIVGPVKDGKQDTVYKSFIPKSVNRPTGIEFSYTGWLRIDDFAYNYGKRRVIFVKGSTDLSVACPALVIDGNTNSLLVIVDTFGAQETIPVVSVPANKWLHVAIVVNQEAVDVYINGTLYAHHILNQLPKQNSASVLNSPAGGFAGRIVRVEYHPAALSASEVLSLARKNPPVDEKDQVFPTDGKTITSSFSDYFDISWFNQ
jgi:hypothetical protein